MIASFQTGPERYRHWKLALEGPVAKLSMDVQEDPASEYSLKLNSYDLGVDIELADAIQRIRFEHPEVRAVVLSSLKEKIFCAGANIFMLGGASHPFKVNFCKFTNETRLAIEDASANSGIKFIAALNGTASGGGYELALACDMRFAVSGARFWMVPPALDVIQDFGLTWTLQMVIGQARTMEAVFSGEPLTTEIGERWGFVNRVFANLEELERHVQQLASRIAGMGRDSARLLKFVVRNGVHSSLEDQLRLEAVANGLCFLSSEFITKKGEFLRRVLNAEKGKTIQCEP